MVNVNHPELRSNISNIRLDESLIRDIIETTNITELTETHPVPSICDNVITSVTVLCAYKTGNFIIQRESGLIYNSDSPSIVDIVYTTDGSYLGALVTLNKLLDHGVTEEVQKHPNGRACCIGFNPNEQKWYGWDSQSIYGFGIGSEVKLGDIAFHPSNIEEVEANFRLFWEIDIEKSFDGYKSIETIDYFNHNIVKDNIVGYEVSKTTITSDRSYDTHVWFVPYPKVWGRGSWVAKTLDDAKQMALDFTDR